MGRGMTRLSYEEYLRKFHTLTYKNVGVSMLPLLKQGRDSFTVREVKQYKTNDRRYRLYVWLWCRPYRLRIFLKKIRMRLQSVSRKKREK